ncbi:MFS transporter [Candidatus Bathyarchaeota archaeon]|nr:MFS transporter [Candidatus Bathyarchaeota archaeon]
MEQRNLWALLAINFGAAVYWQVENFWINLYWTREINDSAFNVSLMVSISAIVGVLTHIFIGALSDSSKSMFGRRRVFILWGGMLGAGFMALFPLIKLALPDVALALLLAIILDILITFFGDMTTPTRIALITEHSVKQERGRINASLAVAMGGGSGLVMLIYTFDFLEDDGYFYMASAWMIIGSLVCIYLIDDPPIPDNELTFSKCITRIINKESYRENRDFYHLLILLFIIMLGNNTYLHFVYIYAEKGLGFNQSQVGLMGVINMIMISAISLPLLAVSDRVGRKPVSIITIVLSCIPLVLLSFQPIPDPWMMATCSGCAAGFVTANNLTLQSWLQDLCPPTMKASLLAYIMVFSVIPMAPGSLLGGFIADSLAVPPSLYSPAFFGIAALIMGISVPGLARVRETVIRHVDE